ncbi:hypothetical protein [Actinomadura rupiterrae]|uniref:hypothetical protein n=1 Tax=Actinomadura rupiterrae TaxID=559627 RepID=UPI0020A4AC66|nr:hypothetical protein [Actinomadura rupiterrae]MCP2342577.1 hypothetical protein [Actinomadura rupiterrae]
MPSSHVYIRGLPLPALLLEFLATRAWPTHDDAKIRAAIPWFKSPLDFLAEQDRTFTFVIDLAAKLRLAPQRSEHVACAGGEPVLSAGEITFEQHPTGWAVTDISNQSTGYCPDVTSFTAIKAALDNAGLVHPGHLTHPVVFRRCPQCHQLNIVKDAHYACALCDHPLPTTWNASLPSDPPPGDQN